MSLVKRIVSFTLLLSIIFYILGVYNPIMTTQTVFLKLRLTSEDVTILSSIRLFFEMKEPILGIVIFLFSIITPIVEFLAIAIRIIYKKSNALFESLDKWSMLDVFLVALLLLNFKMNSTIIVMSLGVGTLYIALSVIFRITAITLLDVCNRK